MDALSEFLRTVKLSGAMFYDARCSAPWCVRSPPVERWRDYVAPASSHVVEFHLVTEGRCYVRLGDETTALAAGDIVMLPHGDEHYLGNGVGAAVVEGESDLHKLLTRQIALETFGGGGEPTHFVCGYLACDARRMRPVLAGLPRVVRVRLRDDVAGTWLENTIRHSVTQATAGAPGSDVILRRLAEVLFVEALRRYVVALPPGLTGWLAGAADPAVGRALAAMHRRTAHAWTLAEIAREAGLSRSALTERFTRYLGQSPMNYFADWRLELAAETLRTTNLGVVEVAAQVGYESGAAFNRAFKRRFALPPARYRRDHRGADDGAGAPRDRRRPAGTSDGSAC
jgi:AraC-like DNA-binding protein